MRVLRDTAFRIALAWFAILLAFASSIGPSDDEAYYWVLAQHPALGYAFHPPATPWMIALFGAYPIAGWMRLPGVLSCALMLWLLLRWLLARGVPEEKLPGSALFLLSFAPLFGLGWMMVPDVPLFLGFVLAWCGSDAIARGKAGNVPWISLGAGCALAPLAKFSGVAIPFSAVLSFFLTAPPEVRSARGLKMVLVSLLGLGLGVLPGVLWNAKHDWAAFRFQLEGRHGSGQISWKRWMRFFAIELFACGPVVLYSLRSLAKPRDLLRRQVLAWALPPLIVFGIQPLFSDFKPHWALIAWFPFALDWAVRQGTGERPWEKLFRIQRGYGLLVIGIVWIAALMPLAPEGTDPRMDVTNDLVGWRDWAREVHDRYGEDLGGRFVVGSRYQTASQAAFALGSTERVSLYPRSPGEEPEWGAASFADPARSGEWPRLRSPVLFVADNRYGAGPDFPDAVCEMAMRTEAKRSGKTAKVMNTWECRPK